MVEPEVAVQEAPTVEERLEAAETQIKGLDSQLRNLEWILGMGAIVITGCVVLYAVLGIGQDDPPKPSNADTSLEELLAQRVHCYDSAPERAVARQRALAAIDRLEWEHNHPTQTEWPLGSPGPAPVKFPEIVDSPTAGEVQSWDETLCFKVA